MRYSLLAPSPGVLTEVAAGTAEAVAAASRLFGERTFPIPEPHIEALLEPAIDPDPTLLINILKEEP